MIWKKPEGDDAPTPASYNPQPAPAPVSHHPAPARREHALIGPSIEIKGNLTGSEDLSIEGRVEGKIELQQNSITVGKNGRVRADIVGRVIVIMGEVDGNVYGEEQILLRQASVVQGNLFAPRVTLEDGARFKGTIDMAPRTAVETPALHPGPDSKPSGPMFKSAT